MKVKVLNIACGNTEEDIERELQALYDEGYRIVDIAGAKRHLIILERDFNSQERLERYNARRSKP